MKKAKIKAKAQKKVKVPILHQTKTHRLSVTVEVSIPIGWTIGDTEDWFMERLGANLRRDSFDPGCIVGMQRIAREDESDYGSTVPERMGIVSRPV
jgi:hypothetical protein